MTRDVIAVYPGTATSVPEARAWARQQLADLPAEVRADVALCVSELAANAVQHTASGRPGGRYSVRLVVTESVVVEVCDQCGTRTVPCITHPSEDAEGGRGLALLASLGQVSTGLADPHGPTGPGRCVRVSLPLPDSHQPPERTCDAMTPSKLREESRGLRSALRAVQDRRRARLRYLVTKDMVDDLWHGPLCRVTDHAERSRLLRMAADLTRGMAIQHPAVWGPSPVPGEGRDWAEVLAAEADLLMLAAEAEAALTLSTWRRVEALTSGDTFDVGGRWALVLDLDRTEQDGREVVAVTVATGDQVETLHWEPEEIVRTGGPEWSELDITEVAVSHGVAGPELAEWQRLAATADRAQRAAILYTLAELAAPRVGATAAEVLADLATTEVYAAAGVTPPRRPGLSSAFIARVCLAGLFALVGVALIVGEVPGPWQVQVVLAPVLWTVLLCTAAWCFDVIQARKAREEVER